jgi:predicted ATP-dependent serine protease
VRRVSSLERRLSDAARLGFHTALVPQPPRGANRGDQLPQLAGITAVAVSTLENAVQIALEPGALIDAPRRVVPLRAVPGR